MSDILPLDWDELKRERLEHDDGSCVQCGEDSGLYVVLLNHPDEVEDGYSIDNMATVCDSHCADGSKVDETKVDESHGFGASSTEGTDSRVSGETGEVDDDEIDVDEYRVGSDSESSSSDSVRESSDDNSDIGYGSTTQGVDSMDSDTGGSGLLKRRSDSPVYEAVGENNSTSGFMSRFVDSVRKGGLISKFIRVDSRDDGTIDDECAKYGDYRFGEYIRYPSILLRLMMVVGLVMGVVFVSGGVASIFIGGPEVTASFIEGFAVGVIDTLVTVMTTPLYLLAVFGVTYAISLFHRDFVSEEWPRVRWVDGEGYSPEQKIGIGVFFSAVGIVLLTASIGFESGTGAWFTSAFIGSVMYLVSIGALVVGMNESLVVRIRDFGSDANAFMWEFPMRVGAVGAVVEATVGLGVVLAPWMSGSIGLFPAFIGALYVVSVWNSDDEKYRKVVSSDDSVLGETISTVQNVGSRIKKRRGGSIRNI